MDDRRRPGNDGWPVEPRQPHLSGLQTENWVRVLVGCAAAAALALAVDGLLALVESGLAQRSRWRIRLGLAGIAAALGLAFLPLSAAGGGGDTVVIGAKNFSERYILASVIERRLQAAGFRTERRDNLGSTVAYEALAAGDIDVYVDYSGTLWTNILQRRDTPPPEAMRAALAEALRTRNGVRLVGPLGFENAYALAMRGERARALGVRALDDLAGPAPRLRLGADLEFLTRPEWRSVREAYGLRFAEQRSCRPSCTARSPTARPMSSRPSRQMGVLPRSTSFCSPIRVAPCRAMTPSCSSLPITRRIGGWSKRCGRSSAPSPSKGCGRRT